MRLAELASALQLQELTPELRGGESLDITHGYVSDLLSDVLAHAPDGGVLVTGQVHMNVVAVAVHAGLAAVIFAMSRDPEPAVRTKAMEEGVRLYRSPLSSFDIVGRMHALGLRGPNE